MFEKGRRSIHVSRDIKAGERFDRSDLVIKRPGYGLPVYMLNFIIGRKAKARYKDGSVVN